MCPIECAERCMLRAERNVLVFPESSEGKITRCYAAFNIKTAMIGAII